MCFSAFQKFADFLFDFGRPVSFDCFRRGEKTPIGRDSYADGTFNLKNLLAEVFEEDFITSAKIRFSQESGETCMFVGSLCGRFRDLREYGRVWHYSRRNLLRHPSSESINL
jgi:hypothetical protein